ncbi:hypothetical protein BH11PSE7_BH11PSE7_19200 [soil metagenome]
MIMHTSLLDGHGNGITARAPLAIIDDEADITSALAAWARLNDIEPVVYHRGVELFQGLQAHDGLLCWQAPDGALRELGGAIIDVGLPGLCGFEVAHALRRLAPHLPLVIMTAMNAAECASMGTPPPGVVVLQKPFDLDALDDCLLAVRAGAGHGPAPG